MPYSVCKSAFQTRTVGYYSVYVRRKYVLEVKKMKETTDFVPSPRMKFALVTSSEMTEDSFRINSNTRSSDMKWPKISLFLKAACL